MKKKDIIEFLRWYATIPAGIRAAGYEAIAAVWEAEHPKKKQVKSSPKQFKHGKS